MTHITNVIYGIIFGVANVIPGVSGGTMLVVFGIFNKLIDAITLDIAKLKKNLPFLLTFGIGVGMGIIGFSHLISYLFENYSIPTYMFFIGLILGSCPTIYKYATKSGEDKLTPICVLPFLLAFGLVITLAILEKNSPDTAVAVQTVLTPILFVQLTLALSLAAVAMIIPGVSGSFLMMLIGVYQTVIASVKDFNIPIMIPVGLGIIIGLLLGARLIRILLNKYHKMVYSAIFGLVFGSVYAILPSGTGLNIQTIIGVAMFVLGGFISLTIGKTGAESD